MMDETSLEISGEIERLRNILDAVDVDIATPPGASLEQVRQIEEKVEITLDDGLKALWLHADGSDGQLWFAAGDGAMGVREFTPCHFLSLEQASRRWSPYDDIQPGIDEDRDARIQANVFRHHLWFPIGENYGGPRVQFDAFPSGQGVYGQIILFEHDPDMILYLAPTFIEFFALSNDILENSLDDDPITLRKKLLREPF